MPSTIQMEDTSLLRQEEYEALLDAVETQWKKLDPWQHQEG